jgi:diguanylate cyclase (GGDEF)-like protein
MKGEQSETNKLDPTQIREQLKQCKTLPTLPGVAVELINQFRSSEVNLEETSKIIQRDPALTATVLKFVNSPCYGVRKEIRSVTHAIALLGLNAIRTIALSFSLVRGLRRSDKDGFDYTRYWQRSILTGVAARAMGNVKGLLEVDHLFLAGLLQDIGMLALQELMPELYGDICQKAAGDHTKQYELEKELLGTDHTEVGAWLAEMWHLPEVYALEIRGSHDPESVEISEELEPVVQCVSLSGWLAEIWLDQSASLIYLKSRAWMQLMGGMGDEDLKAIATEMKEYLSDFSSLFEIQVGDREKADELLLEARDQLTAISLEHVQVTRQVELEREQLANENVELRERSYRDSLTGLYNRAYFDEFLVDEFVRNAALGKSVSAIFCDVDSFKQFNDTYGHKVGDEVLTAVGQAIKKEIRQYDQAVRFGGDEFAVVLPGANSEVGGRIAERISNAVAEMNITLDGGEQITIGISAGCATHDQETPFHCLEALCHAADVELYNVKRARKGNAGETPDRALKVV